MRSGRPTTEGYFGTEIVRSGGGFNQSRGYRTWYHSGMVRTGTIRGGRYNNIIVHIVDTARERRRANQVYTLFYR